jgi:autotransporter translocation and assembly factor TamB
VADHDQPVLPRGKWRRRTAIVLAVVCGLVIIFHRPLLLSIGHRIALHFAARENLKLDFQVEGNVFTSLTVRNLHAVPTGPSDVESIDVDFARVHYGLFSLIRHGPAIAVRNVEVHSARVVLNPAKAPLRPRPPNPKKKITLPDFFPEKVHLVDGTVIVRNKPHDFVVEHADLDLDPRNPGALKIDKVQLVGGQTWLKVSAQTTYANRNLVLRDLVLANDERVRSLHVDASHISSRKLTGDVDYPVGTGSISGSFQLSEARSSLNIEAHIRAQNVPAGVINKYAALPEDWVRGKVEKLDVDLSGLLSSPRTWKGTIAGQISNFQHEAIAFDHAVFQVSAENGAATLKSADVIQGENNFHLRGSAELPEDIKDFGRSPATIEVAAAALDLQHMTARMPQPQRLSGSAQLNGRIDIHNGKLNAEASVSAGSIGFPDGTAEKLNAAIKATKIMPPADAKKPWYADLQSESTLEVTKVRFRDFAADSITCTGHSSQDLMTLENLLVKRNRNELSVRGEYRLPEDFRDASRQPAKVDLSLNAIELGDYWTPNSADKISGPLQINGQVQWKDGVGNGQLSIYGSNLRVRDLVVQNISSQCLIVNSTIYLNDFTASLNESDFVSANTVVDLHAPFHYRGKVSANIADLSVLKPLLHGEQKELAGSFALNWEGSGEGKSFRNSGKLKLALEKGRFGQMQSLQANVDATYSPDGLDVPIISFGNDKMYFQAIAQAKGETLEITKIQLDQGKAKYASGYASIPFIWKNLGTAAPLSPANGKVTVTFQSENLDIKKLFQDVGATPVASGLVGVKLDAKGTLADLDARLDVQMRDLRSELVPKLEPASFDLSAQVQKNQLNIAGKLQQTKIQPLELTATLPFNAAKIMRAHKFADDTPVTAKVRLPRSSVNFIRQFAPEVQQLDGDIALDVDVSGTLAKPVLSGSGDMTVNVARANNSTLPALNNFKARLNFAHDALTLEQFNGELSGGKFTLSGRITFPKLTQADLDLQFKADSILVLRNDAVTMRTDADIKVLGPFTKASVTGTVAMTNSQFLKNIDLLPIGLPGRPAPEPPSSRPEFSFPQPPFRDWQFDVVIKTKDPFLIRGNLANGGATSDLHLIGTGLHPGLQGLVRLENVEATLPFSRLEIAYGFLYFDPSDSLNPRMDLHGTSVIRDYTIHVYIYGTSLAPEAVFTSEPPLPQEEVISLLATGTTREELTGNNNVLASRAATLLVQQLYRKIFKKTGETQSSSVFDRLDLDVGQTDPRTGQREATARFKLNDQFVLTGDLDVAGGFKGMVKYLIRFH